MIPYGDMLQNYYRAIAAKATAARAERLAKITSENDALAEVEAAKQRLKKAFGDITRTVPLEPNNRLALL